MSASTMLDVLGILESVGDFVTLTLKNGKETNKRSVVLRDNSNRSIELTLWGAFASDPGDQMAQVTVHIQAWVPCFSLCMTVSVAVQSQPQAAIPKRLIYLTLACSLLLLTYLRTACKPCQRLLVTSILCFVCVVQLRSGRSCSSTSASAVPLPV